MNEYLDAVKQFAKVANKIITNNLVARKEVIKAGLEIQDKINEIKEYGDQENLNAYYDEGLALSEKEL